MGAHASDSILVGGHDAVVENKTRRLAGHGVGGAVGDDGKLDYPERGFATDRSGLV